MAGCPLGLLLCKTLPGNRRVDDQPDEGLGRREPASQELERLEKAPVGRFPRTTYAEMSMQAELLKEALGKK
jgi:hypothetical protein